jgi:hypothetical protein
MQVDLSAGGCASHPPEGGSRECEVVLGGDHNRHGPSGIALAIDARCCGLFRPVARGARYDFGSSPSRQRSVEFRDLEWAIIASHHRSLRQAAEALDIRQSTLSRRLRDMEARLGAKLFERTNGGTRPTIAGREFLASAKPQYRAEVRDGTPGTVTEEASGAAQIQTSRTRRHIFRARSKCGPPNRSNRS